MLDQSVGVIGVGRLGSDVAFALAEQDLCDIVLYDQEPRRAEYLATDLSDTSFGRVYNRRIRCVSRMSDLSDCDVILVAAGARLGPDVSEATVYEKNKLIIAEIANALIGSSSIIVMASEPVDLMTSQLRHTLKVPQARVLGVGGIVDAFVARNAIGDALDVSPDYIRTHVVGPHGGGAQLAWRYTSINGIPIDQITDPERIKTIEKHALQSLNERLVRLDQSNSRYAPAMASIELIRSIVRDDRRILSVTVDVEECYGVSGMAMSVPCVIGRFGAERLIPPELESAARKAIQDAAASHKKLLAGGAA